MAALQMKSTCASRLSNSSARAPIRASRVSRVAVRAQKQDESPLGKIAAATGFEEGLFGFNPQVELFVGRSAMMGFATAIVGEFAGKGGALSQLGLETPSPALLVAIGGAALLATTVGAARTASRLNKRDMPTKELARYRSFLGLDKEGDIGLAAAAMKGQAPGAAADAPAAAAAAAAAAASPAAAMAADGAAAAEAASPAPAPPAGPAAGPVAFGQNQYAGGVSDFDYAANVERTNGRWAALGFLAAILVEAATGKGILGQLIIYGKLSGLLGAASGF